MPGIMVRAYADDTAIILRDFWKSAGQVADIFWTFSRVSGLHLNMKKSIIVPLNACTFKDFASRVQAQVPRWRDMPVQLSSKYLGYTMGPGKGDLSWSGPAKKFEARVSLWSEAAAGIFWAIRVHKQFLCSAIYRSWRPLPPGCFR